MDCILPCIEGPVIHKKFYHLLAVLDTVITLLYHLLTVLNTVITFSYHPLVCPKHGHYIIPYHLLAALNMVIILPNHLLAVLQLVIILSPTTLSLLHCITNYVGVLCKRFVMRKPSYCKLQPSSREILMEQ